MDTGVLIGVATLLLAFLTYLGFIPNGPHLFARLMARIQAPRKDREELRKLVEELQSRIEKLEDKVKRVTYAAWVGLPYSVWDEAELEFGPEDEPAKEPPRLQAPEPRRGSD
jgi:hypothetical protein